MTTRTHFFPRLDVRDGPAVSGSTSTGAQWRAEWAQAIARAGAINALPSAYQGAQRTPRTGDEAATSRRENARLARIFDYGEVES